MITFNPKQITETFFAELPKRSQDIIVRRYGLSGGAQKSTLDSIGKKYGITRERVRQIENYSLKNARKSKAFEDAGASFGELADLIKSTGGVVAEEDLLNYLSEDALTQNYFYLLLVLGASFAREKEDSEFRTRWFLDPKLSEDISAVLREISKNWTNDILIPESELVSLFNKQAQTYQSRLKNNEEDIKRWLALSKIIGKNSFDEWGLAVSPNIKTRGIRSYAYLVVRQHGSPMHFTEVAKKIQEHFNKKAHIATCHNELIKDERFVLVGRGLYALTEWGYSQGVVREVIRDILKKKGFLSKEEIIKQVLKERYVKENTVLVNLQNSNFFKKKADGTYAVAN
ncbi:MAG: hypothetical protein KAV41_01220 [Candidatus Pacebacteria bacterium]|nr:hypothetical protein [Candidatus Paceibacterota bacterium]